MKIRTRVERYKVLVADPPWMFDDKLGTRGAEAKYKGLPLDQIKNFSLPPLADDCVLFLWRVAAMQEEAFAVARAWGFVPNKGEMVWSKMTKTGKQHFGMGHIVRGCHEVAIIATRGKPQRLNASTRSLFAAPTPCSSSTGRVIHSAKPDVFFELVRNLYDGPRVSVFDRFYREGFTCLGDEVGKYGQAA